MYLFVYGSLKRLEYNHNRYGFGDRAEFIREATSSDIRLYQIPDVVYPHAVLEPSNPPVHGEVYFLNLRDQATADMFSNILRMELDAGYSLAQIKYSWPRRYGNWTVTAFTFVAKQQLTELLRDPIYQAIPITEWKGPRHDV